MSASTDKKQALKGAEWLIKESSAFETFIPEDFNEEQQMVKDMCNAFLDAEVLPVIDRIDKLEQGLMPSLIQKAGEQGLLGVAVPEEYGGLGKDFITATLVNEGLGGGFSFSVGVPAHTGIGTLPILYERSDGHRLHAAIQPVNDTSERPRRRQRDVSLQ